MINGNDYPAVHKKPETPESYKRLDMLWERYPQYRVKKPVPDINDLVQEHESWQEDFTDELREEYQKKQYDQFLVQLSWEDLPYRHETRDLIESASFAYEESQNPYVENFMNQFTGFDTDRKAYFLFPESFSSQFMVMLEVCRRAEVFRPIQNLFPDEDRVHYIAVFDKRNMDDVLLPGTRVICGKMALYCVRRSFRTGLQNIREACHTVSIPPKLFMSGEI